MSPPTGYTIVKSGSIRAGDLAWHRTTQKWIPAPSLLNYPAEDYAAICRKEGA